PISSSGGQIRWLDAIETLRRRSGHLEALIPRTGMVEKIEIRVGRILDDAFGSQCLRHNVHNLLIENFATFRVPHRNQVIFSPGKVFELSKVEAFRTLSRDFPRVGTVAEQANKHN